MRAYNINDYVLFWPGVLVAIVIAALASGWLARVTRRPRPIAFGLAFSVGVIVAATLTPGRDALLFGIPGSGSCDLAHVPLPTLTDLRTFNDTSLNVLLFVPLGFTTGFGPATRRTVALVVGAFAFPLAIETIQFVVTPLGRSCQGVDIVDNVTGLVVGLAIAGLAAAVGRLVGPGGVSAADLSEPRP